MELVEIELTVDVVSALGQTYPGLGECGAFYADGVLSVPASIHDEIVTVLDAIDMVAIGKSNLTAYAADKRWRKEVGGIVVGGVPVATDDRSKLLIAGARIKADANPEFTTKWKTDGGFVLIDAATIIAVSDAVLAHVDACFAMEDEVIAEIDAGAVTTREQVDAVFAQ